MSNENTAVEQIKDFLTANGFMMENIACLCAQVAYLNETIPAESDRGCT
jgi:hypothetical protein